MTIEPYRNNDPRTVDELFNATLSESDEESVWTAVCALHWRGTREVFQRAAELCVSQCSHERAVGADILGQLGVHERSFPDESTKLLRSMLKIDEEADVLDSVLIALSHHHDLSAVPIVVRFSKHSDPDVRRATVFALTGYETQQAIECLLSLSNDPIPNVRDWATFALGTQIELDTPEIRDALADRLRDPDIDTRAEALVGLAYRKDGRTIDAMKKELSSASVGTLVIEAAELIASNELHSHLIALRKWWDVDPELLERAISVSQS